MSRQKSRGRKGSKTSKRQKQPNMLLWLGAGLVLLIAFLAWLAHLGKPNAEIVAKYGFPPFLASADSQIQMTYARAVDYRDELGYMACYCGCGPGNGHRSLRDCFIENAAADGQITYSSHAAT